MPTATITMLYCVQQATGTDFAVNEALAQLPEKLLPADVVAPGPLEVVKALPGASHVEGSVYDVRYAVD